MRQHLSEFIPLLETWGDGIALVEQRGVRRVRTSYRELARMARSFATYASLHGAKRGDRVLLWAPNSAEWLAVFYGCLWNGLVAVPLDVESAPDFVERISTETQPVLKFTSFPPELFTQTPQAEPAPGLSAEDPLQIVFTSGTTAEPKGVIHTHRNLLVSIHPIEREMTKYRKYEKWFHPLRFLHTLPFSHVFGQFMGFWMPPLLGAELHLAPSLHPARLLDDIARERISVLVTVPGVVEGIEKQLLHEFPDLQQRLTNAPQSGHFLKNWWLFRDVHRRIGWKFWAIISGGATLPEDREAFFRKLGYAIVQGYGMTETAALVSLNHPFKLSRGSIGKVLPGREIKIENGELLIRGSNVAQQFWRNGSIETRGQEEWLRTGDLAEVDASGNLFFKGRSKDVIVTAAGMNIYPDDLEKALLKQTGVSRVAVVNHDNEPHPVLILQPGTDASAAIRDANAMLASHQQMRRWTVWPEPDFPRTSTGKVLKRILVEAIAQGQGRSAQQLRGSWLSSTLERLAPGAVSNDGSLALDSLSRAQLLAEIEDQYGISLDAAQVQNAASLDALQLLIQCAGVPSVDAQSQSATPHYPFPKYPRYWPRPWVRLWFQETIMLPLVWLIAGPRRVQHVDTPKRPCLIIANHLTRYDVPLILATLPFAVRRKTAVAMSGKLLRDWRYPAKDKPLLRKLADFGQYWLVVPLFHVFSLPADAAFRDALRHAGELMDLGYHVLVFPEGRRSESDEPAEFQAGAGVMLQSLNADVIAVRMRGVGSILRGENRAWKRGDISVYAAGPYSIDTQRDPKEITAELRSLVVGSGERQ